MTMSKAIMLKFVLLPTLLVMVGMTIPVESSFAAKGKNNQGGQARGIDQAVASIQKRTGGRVLRASQVNSYYVIKVLLPSGVVKTYRIKAK